VSVETATSNAWQRTKVFAGVVGLLTLAGAVFAVLRPAWLTVPLQNAIEGAGVWGPLVFVVLCVLAASLRLHEPLVVMSSLFWPLPVALALSYAGTLLGSFLTALLLSKMTRTLQTPQQHWPASLQRLAGKVSQRPIFIGLVARVVMGAGIALEAFFVLTNYSKRHYIFVTVLGVALSVAQMLLGVTLVRALIQISPFLVIVLVLLILSGVLIVRRSFQGQKG
jgi:hypothetical protein